ncbi:hypothetical protein TVAG_119040 [Trichomonas vaginalis G3]|uniref:Uncharacterized protein n=1 Tax=Trichomonas vaginalis (strain ATCC PRA-98 / G3) TaxID=412133 RepID=A2D751_TRIV3|nr:hypothetical protein TVAGG3_0991720 [Trichomonas vaginalis G3]EAY23568.1 hypothetical protein TVAG_119040 [Trichomonas vaginalis G3]KAI5490066.1 hypothetical protein TVAGG3_0991720 [Trichomonas vaginalis G3]|eukprot:XP_001276816.1 hypothetical protein [Trichomonas vaginalis G3]
MGSCCSKTEALGAEEEDSEEGFQEIQGMPEPGQPPPPAENPINSPSHISIYHNADNPLDGKEEFPEVELSPVSDHFDD